MLGILKVAASSAGGYHGVRSGLSALLYLHFGSMRVKNRSKAPASGEIHL